MKKIDSVKTKAMLERFLQQLIVSGSAIVIALVLGMVLIALMDINPLKAFAALLEGAFGSTNDFAETLVKMTPLLFTGMSYALANRCGLTNLGMEGQMYMGALFAAAAGIYLENLPTVLHIPLCIAAGFIGGRSVVPARRMAEGTLRCVGDHHHRDAQYLAINFIEFMVNGPMIEPPGINCQNQPAACHGDVRPHHAGHQSTLGVRGRAVVCFPVLGVFVAQQEGL